MVGGVAGEHVGQPGLHPDADERQPPCGAPLFLDGELLVAELDAGRLYGCSGWRCERLIAMSR